MRPEDRVRLRHMLDAARDALVFADGRSRNDLDVDRQLTLALVKCLEIVGEAAYRTSKVTRSAVPELPWREMIDMRHILVHGYYDINLDILWNTVQQDLPPLVAALEREI